MAREAFGGMFMVDSPEQRRSRIPDNERLALEDWLRIADFDDDDVWPRRWAEQYVTRARDDVGAWLREIGVRFFPVVNWAERGNFGDGNSVPRFHLTWGTGKALVQAVWGAIEAHPRRSALQISLSFARQRARVGGRRIVGCRVLAEDDDLPSTTSDRDVDVQRRTAPRRPRSDTHELQHGWLRAASRARPS